MHAPRKADANHRGEGMEGFMFMSRFSREYRGAVTTSRKSNLIRVWVLLS